MNRSIQIKVNQTLADIAVLYGGGLWAWPEMARLNNLSLTEVVSAGTVLILPGDEPETVSIENRKVALVARYEVGQGQTIADLAVQYVGSVSGWFALAQLNGWAMTEEVSPGTVFKIPEPTDRRVEKYFRLGGYKPATGVIADTLSGIDYMGIEFDFIIS